jgi:hypothetical protein
MPDNNMAIMVGLGLVGLWFMNRQRGSQEDQVGQLTGASMMAAGEGTAPDAPFQAYSAPANPIFFFNQGGQMTKVPGTNVPLGASSDEDIGIYPGGIKNRPELEFTVARSIPPDGTSDPSPTTPEFAGTAPTTVIASSFWDQQALIASANFTPLLAVQTTSLGGIDILGSTVDIATISSTDAIRVAEQGRAPYTTTPGVLGRYVAEYQQGVIDFATNQGQQTRTQSAPADPAWLERQEWDLDIGI